MIILLKVFQLDYVTSAHSKKTFFVLPVASINKFFLEYPAA